MARWNECKKCGKQKYSPTCPYCGFTSFFVALFLIVMLVGCATQTIEELEKEAAAEYSRNLNAGPQQTKDCNLRLDPTGSIIQVVKPGEELEFFSSDHYEWYQVAVGDTEMDPNIGYMHRMCFEEE